MIGLQYKTVPHRSAHIRHRSGINPEMFEGGQDNNENESDWAPPHFCANLKPS
jgi:hypothetical protein